MAVFCHGRHPQFNLAGGRQNTAKVNRSNADISTDLEEIFSKIWYKAV